MKKVDTKVKQTNGRLLEGVVIGTKNDKTILVEVAYVIRHPLYGKQMKRTKKYQVHCTKDIELGAKITIGETKRVSKYKYFKVIEVVK